MVFLRYHKRLVLPEFIRHSKSSPGILPGNIQVRAKDPTGAAFHAALHSDLDRASVLGPVGTHRTEIDTRLVLTGMADSRVDDGQVQFLFVGEIFQ